MGENFVYEKILIHAKIFECTFYEIRLEIIFPKSFHKKNIIKIKFASLSFDVHLHLQTGCIYLHHHHISKDTATDIFSPYRGKIFNVEAL